MSDTNEMTPTAEQMSAAFALRATAGPFEGAVALDLEGLGDVARPSSMRSVSSERTEPKRQLVEVLPQGTWSEP